MSDPAILQPKLEGQRIIVRPIKPEDFAELYSLAYDPSVWEQHPAQKRHLEPEFRAFFDRYTVHALMHCIVKSTFLGKDYWGKQFGMIHLRSWILFWVDGHYSNDNKKKELK